MSLTTIDKFKYKPSIKMVEPPFFEVHQIRLEKACITNYNHQSAYFKIYFIEEGSGTYTIDFKTFSIEGSGLFFISPGQVLRVETEALKSAYQLLFNKEFYCVETHGKDIACNGILFNNIHRASFLQINHEGARIFKSWIQQLITELKNPGRAHLDLLESYVRMILIEALRRHEANQLQNSSNNQLSENRLVRDFIALVDKHFREIHAVSAYAEKLFVSPKSLSKRLQAESYPTPTEVIRERIIIQAKRDLRFSQKSIKEIAHDLGFDDPSYFTRYFKKSEGQSPAQYRSSYLAVEV